MVSTWHRRLRDKVWPEPLPGLESFAGKNVLITGATSGLGQAAAVHFARLGANVILTSRNAAQSQSTTRFVEQAAGVVGQGKVHVIQLNMNQYSSCVSFVEGLKNSDAARSGLDVAVLNAGVINADFMESPEGWYVSPAIFRIRLVFTHPHVYKGANHPSQHFEYHPPRPPPPALDEADRPASTRTSPPGIRHFT